LFDGLKVAIILIENVKFEVYRVNGGVRLSHEILAAF